jgi:hypothetical protein
MKNPTSTTCTTPQTRTFPADEYDFDVRTVNLKEINPVSNFDDFEARLGEAISLAALLKELVSPSWVKHPSYPGSAEIVRPFTSNDLSDPAREGLGYVAMRVESVLMECEEAIFDKGEVGKK